MMLYWPERMSLNIFITACVYKRRDLTPKIKSLIEYNFQYHKKGNFIFKKSLGT